MQEIRGLDQSIFKAQSKSIHQRQHSTCSSEPHHERNAAWRWMNHLTSISMTHSVPFKHLIANKTSSAFVSFVSLINTIKLVLKCLQINSVIVYPSSCPQNAKTLFSSIEHEKKRPEECLCFSFLCSEHGWDQDLTSSKMHHKSITNHTKLKHLVNYQLIVYLPINLIKLNIKTNMNVTFVNLHCSVASVSSKVNRCRLESISLKIR